MTLLRREQFRESVLARDGHRCVVCGRGAADAHHIIERRLWTDGGYYLENGASLCDEHHKAAEATVLSCEGIRAAAGITAAALPPHFDRDERYDKWGNVFLGNSLRVRGELFFDDSVQAILKQGGALGQFTKYVKFPKISHLPWSEGVDEQTDRVLSHEDVVESFQGRDVVVTEKMDGENTSMYRDYVHARSLDSGIILQETGLRISMPGLPTKYPTTGGSVVRISTPSIPSTTAISRPSFWSSPSTTRRTNACPGTTWSNTPHF